MPKPASRRSIDYLNGVETLIHTDFDLPGVLPIVWQRVYRSDFDANDSDGPLGARWMAPYASRFEEHGEELAYYDDAAAN
ncbi:Uncharacterised protein [Chromobacterium violaceum]|uniref:DUF6531 domain-containing protein n=1 Tax=Chromobacterium violaceum TaxID=536 RepID=A0A3S4HPI2_CHRVL|nr:Uncharacterised protein [Chromobacterium violaceum]